MKLYACTLSPISSPIFSLIALISSLMPSNKKRTTCEGNSANVCACSSSRLFNERKKKKALAPSRRRYISRWLWQTQSLDVVDVVMNVEFSNVSALVDSRARIPPRLVGRVTDHLCSCATVATRRVSG